MNHSVSTMMTTIMMMMMMMMMVMIHTASAHIQSLLKGMQYVDNTVCEQAVNDFVIFMNVLIWNYHFIQFCYLA